MILGKNLSRVIFGDAESTKTASNGFNAKEAANISQGLVKVSSMQPDPATIPALMGMMKIAANCINSMSEQLVEVKSSNDELEKRAEVRVIVDDMINNGLADEFDMDGKIASLLDKDINELKLVKEAVGLSIDMRHGNFFEDMGKTAEIKQRKGLFEGII